MYDAKEGHGRPYQRPLSFAQVDNHITTTADPCAQDDTLYNVCE